MKKILTALTTVALLALPNAFAVAAGIGIVTDNGIVIIDPETHSPINAQQLKLYRNADTACANSVPTQEGLARVSTEYLYAMEECMRVAIKRPEFVAIWLPRRETVETATHVCETESRMIPPITYVMDGVATRFLSCLKAGLHH